MALIISVYRCRKVPTGRLVGGSNRSWEAWPARGGVASAWEELLALERRGWLLRGMANTWEVWPACGRRGLCLATLGHRADPVRGWVFQAMRKTPSGTLSSKLGIPNSSSAVTPIRIPKHRCVVFPNSKLISCKVSK